MTPRDRHRGLTLVEMVVAVALLALCSLLLSEGLHISIRAWQKTTASADRGDAAAAARRFLGLRLREALPFVPGPETGADAAFSGLQSEITFSTATTHAGAIGETRYRVRVRRTPAANDLIVEWRPVWAGRPRDARDGWQSEVLVPNVQGVSFRYLAATADAEPQWRATWDARSAVPAAVSVDVRLARDDARRWTRLIVRPFAQADALCEFDPVSRQCRA